MMLLFWSGAAGQIMSGGNDFLAFYAGARLSGTADLYDAEITAEVQLSAAKATAPVLRLTRPPFYALMLSPLGRLTYQKAYLVWVLLNAGALVGFIAIWREGDRRALVAACCCSVPVAASFANGQDVPFLLLLVAVSMRLFQGREYFLAGLVLSLCAAKYNLFLLVPLVLLAQGPRKMVLGAATGLLALIGLSFLAAGRSWPFDYWSILNHPIVLNDVAKMPNLNGVTSSLALGRPVMIALSIVVAAGCWMIARRLDFRTAFAAAVLGSGLVSYHSYLADTALLIPAIVILAEQGALQRYLALGLLTPVPWFILLRGGLAANVTRAALVLLFASCVCCAIRTFAISRESASGQRAIGIEV